MTLPDKCVSVGLGPQFLPAGVLATPTMVAPLKPEGIVTFAEPRPVFELASFFSVTFREAVPAATVESPSTASTTATEKRLISVTPPPPGGAPNAAAVARPTTRPTSARIRVKRVKDEIRLMGVTAGLLLFVRWPQNHAVLLCRHARRQAVLCQAVW